MWSWNCKDEIQLIYVIIQDTAITTSNFSLQYQPWNKHKAYENKMVNKWPTTLPAIPSTSSQYFMIFPDFDWSNAWVFQLNFFFHCYAVLEREYMDDIMSAAVSETILTRPCTYLRCYWWHTQLTICRARHYSEVLFVYIHAEN